MLGDLVYDTQGKITGTRVLDDANEGLIEFSGQEKGTVLGIDCTVTLSYWVVPRSDGTMYGEGRAVVMTADGNTATYRGTGIGVPTGRPPAMRSSGALCFFSDAPKLKRLAHCAVVFENEQNEDGTYHIKGWEWK